MAAAATPARALEALAPTVELLLFKVQLAPSGIVTNAVDQLNWVGTAGIAATSEPFSHLDGVDVAATVAAAHQAFRAVEPLGRLVAPAKTAEVAADFAALDRSVARLGGPSPVPDRLVAALTWRSVAERGRRHRRRLRRARTAAAGLRSRAPRLRPRTAGLVTPPERPGAISRRSLLAGSGLATAGLVAAAACGNRLAGAEAPPSSGGGESTVAFLGEHQAGIVTPPQDRLVFATYDMTEASPQALRALLATWSEAAATLTAGKALPGAEQLDAPVPDTGEALGLGAARLTITVGFGPSLFDRRFGLAARRPAALIDLPAFAGDALDPTRSGGDLCVQACADDAQVAFHAVRNLSRLALGTASLRYLQVGFARTSSGPASDGTPRNLLGFKDGTDNLRPADTAALDRFVWAGGDGDKRWMRGGTYLVARRIRTHLEAWDRTTLAGQQAAIGRDKASGAPLGGSAEHDTVDLTAVGADGTLQIPPGAHIRVASPSANGGQHILRRGYSFADGVDPRTGEIDAGLFFICFQRDPARQFVAIQRRLAAGDTLAQYLTHTGSGIFACPPGVAVAGEPFGAALL